MSSSTLEQQLRTFILTEFLPGEDPAHLSNDTPLISTGILDSIATLRLVAYLEKTFSIAMEAHETGADHLDTVSRIADLVRLKGGSVPA